MEISNELANKKPKRLTSVVWNHFERVRKTDTCYAVCIHCNKRLSGSSNSGTTHLRNHLMRCLKRSNYDVSQLLAAKRRKKEGVLSLTAINYDEGQGKEENLKPSILKFDQEQKKDEPINTGSIRFDQERSRLDLARMIILHGYPLSMVNHVGFKVFVKDLQPLFEVNSAIELDCLEIYGKEKQKVYEIISSSHGRINLAIDMWTSPEQAEYLCLTAHYVNENWELETKILNFVTLDSSHTEDMLSEVIIKCLVEWEVGHKLFSITFHDCAINNDIIPRVKGHFSQDRPLLGSGQLLDVRCAGHILNLIIQDCIEALREVTHKIRESIRYVKTSQATLGKFNEIAQQVGVNSPQALFYDCPTQWNSTYRMLERVLEYKGAFSILQEHEPGYTIGLSDTEWEWTSSVTSYMKLLIEIVSVLSNNKCPTANVYFPEICDVHLQLIEWCKSPDDFISSLALKMKAKFDKYWSKCSLALAVAAILDPRFKMKLVEYYYPQIYGADAADRIKDVSDGIKELFNAYCSTPASLHQGVALPGSSLPSSTNDSRDRLKGFDKFIHETSQNQNIVSDLDKYLEEPVFPRNCDFNILNWWRVQKPRYPVLSMMVRDVLGIPMSTVSPQDLFSAGARVLDHYRSSLNPDTRQALICTQDWLQTGLEEPSQSIPQPVLPLAIEAN